MQKNIIFIDKCVAMTVVRNNIPPQNTLGGVIAKATIGLFLGAVLGFVFFFLLTFVGNNVSAFATGGELGSASPLLSILLLIVTLISTFVGVFILIATYSVLYGDEYYDFRSMFRYTLITNMVIFLFLVPVYLLFMKNSTTLFFVMALHMALAVYVCSMQIEIMVNPHYAISSSIGATLGMVRGMLLYAVIIAISSQASGSQENLMAYIVWPPILMYTMIPLGQGIRRMIYMRMYESGSDPLYVPSPSEFQQMTHEQAQQDDEIHVEMT